MPRLDRTFSAEDLFRIFRENLTPEEQDRFLFFLAPEAGLIEQNPVELLVRIFRIIENPGEIVDEAIDLFFR